MPSVAFSRTQSVAASPDEAWTVLTDVERLISWVSVLEEAREHEPLSRYSAVLADRLGPFRLRADLEITVTDVEEPARLTLRAVGEDRQVASRITVDATLRLLPGDPQTTVEVSGSYEVAGRVATLGAGTITKKADRLLDEFFAAVRDDLGDMAGWSHHEVGP